MVRTSGKQDNRKKLPSAEVPEGALFFMEIDSLATNQENFRTNLRDIDQNRPINSMIKIHERQIGKKSG